MRLTARLASLRTHAKRAGLGAEDGYTMIAAVGAVTLITVLAAAALAATNGDLHLVRYDLDHKRAHAAAQAGIADYSFHLNNDNDYWAQCTDVPEPNAVNQEGAEPLGKRSVSGSEGAEYAIELLPASTGPGKECDPENPVETMLEQGGAETGSFRIRSTGYAGKAKVSIVASYKRASLLDYIYFTQLETSDPATYPSSWQPGAYEQCTKFIREGRYDDPIPGASGNHCTRIVFVSGDEINGPLHTNDELQVCGTPTFGRGPADVIEVSGPPKGWIGLGCLSDPDNPNFVGPFVTTAPVLTPPPTNSKLKDIAEEEGYAFTGQTRITLKGESIEVKVGSGEPETKPFPSGGVLYVANGSCSSSYSPYARTYEMYPSTSGCGNVIVHGDYSGQLTIAAENDIIVDDDIERSGTGLLGLVANNFVRVYHPLYPWWRLTSRVPQDCNGTSNDDTGIYNGIGTPHNLRIDAAILAINHSFIVDHYNCGASLGTLTVNGAISQKFRGAVGLTSGRGYIKDYNYDDRLRYQEPPRFLNPVESAWHIQRETLDFPE
jgi:hypothetical protein